MKKLHRCSFLYTPYRISISLYSRYFHEFRQTNISSPLTIEDVCISMPSSLWPQGVYILFIYYFANIYSRFPSIANNPLRERGPILIYISIITKFRHSFALFFVEEQEFWDSSSCLESFFIWRQADIFSKLNLTKNFYFFIII